MKDRHIKNTLINIKKERLMSVTNLIIMTISFVVLGVFITIVSVSQTILSSLERQAQVAIFFKDDFLEESILMLEKNLREDERIFSVNYISKIEAYEIFKELNEDSPSLLESATSSILPASLEVRAKDITDLPKLADEFGALDGVEDVRLFKDVVERFARFSRIAYVVGFALVGVFLLSSYTVILYTLRMTINSKGDELEIMKLVGASNSYVRTPLILQGVFYGMVSSFTSGALLLMLVLIFGRANVIPKTFYFGFLPNLSVGILIFSFILWLILVLSGVLLGYFGSSLAVKRYLKY